LTLRFAGMCGLVELSSQRPQSCGRLAHGVEYPTGSPLATHLAFPEKCDDPPFFIVASGGGFELPPCFARYGGKYPIIYMVHAVPWTFRCAATIMMRWDADHSPSRLAKMRSKTSRMAPADEAAEKCVVWAMAGLSFFAMQTMPDHIHDFTRDTPVIAQFKSIRQQEMWQNPLDLECTR
jgi:hypothetical protein